MWPHGDIEVEQPLQWCIQDISFLKVFLCICAEFLRLACVKKEWLQQQRTELPVQRPTDCLQQSQLGLKIANENLHDFWVFSAYVIFSISNHLFAISF